MTKTITLLAAICAAYACASGEAEAGQGLQRSVADPQGRTDRSADPVHAAESVKMATTKSAPLWITVARNDTAVYDFRAGTFNHGERTMSTLGRIRLTDDDDGETSTAFVRWSVSFADCARGYGRLVTTDIEGQDNGMGDYKFMLAGGTNGSSVAAYLCLLAILPKEELNK